MRSYVIVRTRWLSLWLVGAVIGLPVAVGWGDEFVSASRGQSGPAETATDVRPLRRAVGLFDAISSHTVEVRFIAQSAEQASVHIKNVSDAPLHIELPAAFGAVQVLPQWGPGALGVGGAAPGGIAGQGGGQAAFGLGGGGQGLGGGFGGVGLNGVGLNGGALNGMGPGGGFLGGGGFNVGGGGRGFFRIDAGKTQKLNVRTVCLEHGKRDPNPRMTYQIVPLEQVNGDPAITNLCQMLGEGSVSQSAAQAAAWHLANGLTWEELQAKNRHQSRYTGNIRWFSSGDIEAAWQIAQRCRSEAQAAQSMAASERDF